MTEKKRKTLAERMRDDDAPFKFVDEEETQKSFTIYKTDEDQRLVFGWASVAITVDGEELEDRQNDMIEPEDLEEAAYEYVLNFRDAGEEHLEGYRKKGKLVESCVFTQEKQRAMGIPEGVLPVAWWIGFKIEDDDAWQRVKNGTYKMFSIEGKAQREEVKKYNHNHAADGKFSTAEGAGAIRGNKTQQKRDRGEKLTENQFYNIYSAHKLNLRGEDNLQEQIDNIKSDGFKGTGGFGNNVVPASINPKGITEQEMLDHGKSQEAIDRMKENPQGGEMWIDGTYYPHVNVTQKQYGARKGDTVMFVSEADLDVTPNTEKVKNGYKPFEHEIVTVEYDFQPYYELYEKAYEQAHGKTAKSFDEVLKFNPYHGYHGYFSSANTATSFTYNPKSSAGQKAVGRIMERGPVAIGSGSTSGGTSSGSGGSTEHKIAEGKDLLETMDPKKVGEMSIDEVLEAQGFNGKPKVVTIDEFSEAVNENSIIITRGIGADDGSGDAIENVATVDTYIDDLVHGDFYVKCEGGNAMGRGCYGAISYNGSGEYSYTFDTSVEFATNHVSVLNGGHYKIVNMTLDPSAKTIDIHDLEKMAAKDGKKLVTDFNNGPMSWSDSDKARNDIGAYAAAKGYDAITNRKNKHGDGNFINVLNRTKLVILDPGNSFGEDDFYRHGDMTMMDGWEDFSSETAVPF